MGILIRSSYLRKTGFNIKKNIKLIIAIPVLLMLNACPILGQCVLESDWGQFERKTITVNPKNEFTDAGTELIATEPVYMKVSGEIDICPDEYFLNRTTPSGNKAIKPEENEWQWTDVTVEEGDSLSIFVNGEYNDLGATYSDGEGLYVLIEDLGINPNNVGKNDEEWWPNSSGERIYATVLSEPQFFELNNNLSLGNSKQGFSGKAPKDGRIWFKYARNANQKEVKDNISPWKGIYKWSSKCDRCLRLATTCAISSTIAVPLAIAFIGADPITKIIAAATISIALGVCVSGFADCVPSGHAEPWMLIPAFNAGKLAGLSLSNGDLSRECREISGDHIVDGNNDGSEGGESNSGGYNIFIKKGCKGNNGEYLNAIIGAPVIERNEILYTYPDGQRCYPTTSNSEVVCPIDPNTNQPCPILGYCYQNGSCAATQNPSSCSVEIGFDGKPMTLAVNAIDTSMIGSATLVSLDYNDPASPTNPNFSYSDGSSGLVGQIGSKEFSYGVIRTLAANDPPMTFRSPSGGQLWFHINDNEVKASDASSRHPNNEKIHHGFDEGNRCENSDGCLVRLPNPNNLLNENGNPYSRCSTEDQDLNGVPDGYQECILKGDKCIYPPNCMVDSVYKSIDNRHILSTFKQGLHSTPSEVNNNNDPELEINSTPNPISEFISGYNNQGTWNGPDYYSKLCFDVGYPLDAGSRIYVQTSNWDTVEVEFNDGRGPTLSDLATGGGSSVANSVKEFDTIFEVYEMDASGNLVNNPIATIERKKVDIPTNPFPSEPPEVDIIIDPATLAPIDDATLMPNEITLFGGKRGGLFSTYELKIEKSGAAENISVSQINRSTESSIICLRRVMGLSVDGVTKFSDTVNPVNDPRENGFGLNNQLTIHQVDVYAKKAKCNNNEEYCQSKYSAPWGVNYNDNEGNYEVELVYRKNPNNIFSSILNRIIVDIRKVFLGTCRGGATPNCEQGIAQKLYNVFVYDTDVFANSLRALLTLYVALYGFMFMMGMIQDLRQDAVIRVIKVSIVVQLLHPNSWEFFSITLFDAFISATDGLISIMAQDFMGSSISGSSNPINGEEIEFSSINFEGVESVSGVPVSSSNPFAFIDSTIAIIFSDEFFAKIIGLLFFKFGMGLIFVITIFYGLKFYFMAVIKALVIYLLSIVAISMLLILAPVFITFLLFNQTKDLFYSWMKNLANYSLQPVLVFISLAIFNVFVVSALYLLLSFKVCPGCLLPFIFDICLIPGFPEIRTANGQSMDLPTGMFMIMIFLIITSAMLKITDYAAKIAAELTTGNASTSLSKVAQLSMTNATSWYSNFMNTVTLTKYGKKKDIKAEKKKKKNKRTSRRIINAPSNLAKNLFE